MEQFIRDSPVLMRIFLIIFHGLINAKNIGLKKIIKEVEDKKTIFEMSITINGITLTEVEEVLLVNSRRTSQGTKEQNEVWRTKQYELYERLAMRILLLSFEQLKEGKQTTSKKASE